MIRKLLPVVLMIIGTGMGIGAGLLLPPRGGDETTATGVTPETRETAPAIKSDRSTGQHEFVQLNNQFVVPLVEGDRIGAMVVLSLSVEVDRGGAETVYALEPKLRDGFLQVLFDHANRGGFDGEFTNANSMDVLRRLLLETARDRLGKSVHAILITEIGRQDV